MPVPLRVVTYNVHEQKDDLAALAAVVRGLNPDVVAVQEAPRRFGWRHRCANLADSFGLVVAAGGLPGLGNLLLTSLRVRVHDGWCVRLPLRPGRHLRGAAFAACSVGPAHFVVTGSHLGTDVAERLPQARAWKAAMAAVPAGLGPLIAAADLNEAPGLPAWQTVAEGLVDTGPAETLTFSTAAPRFRLDAIFVDPRITVSSSEVVDTPQTRVASDHFPVVADVLLPEADHTVG